MTEWISLANNSPTEEGKYWILVNDNGIHRVVKAIQEFKALGNTKIGVLDYSENSGCCINAIAYQKRYSDDDIPSPFSDGGFNDSWTPISKGNPTNEDCKYWVTIQQCPKHRIFKVEVAYFNATASFGDYWRVYSTAINDYLEYTNDQVIAYMKYKEPEPYIPE